MKKYILTILAAVSVLAGCTKSDEADGVALKAFGPTPVLRGTPIRFIGQNLDRVNEIIFPENVSVTDITRVSNTEITAIVPQEAVRGHVRLVYDGGEITSVSTLGFEEPFSIASISPVGETIRGGDMVTISGDYLYNVVRVVFSGDVAVDTLGFTTKTRTEITLPLPAAAVSGKIYIEDESQNLLYSDEELTVRQPTVTAVTGTPVRPGDMVTITGTDLDLIETVTFTGGAVVGKADFESRSATSIVVAVPDNAQDGAIVATASSGQQVTSGSGIEMVVPSNLSIEAASRFKAGLEMTVSGSDIALVTGLTFAGMTEPTDFTFNGDRISVIIPATATDGPLTLTTASAKNVVTPAVELVKPVITSFAPAEVIAGGSVAVTGSDLDLAVSAAVGGVAGTIAEGADETSLTIVTSPSASSGTIVLTTANGYRIESSTLLTVLPATTPSISALSDWARPGGEVTVEGTLLNYVESVYLSDVKVLSYIARTATSITFTVPGNVPLGAHRIRLVTTDGKEVVSSQSVDIKLSGQDPITDPDLIMLDYEEHGSYNGGWFQAWGCPSELLYDNTVYMRLTGAVSGWQWIMNVNQHDGIPPYNNLDDASKYVLKVDIKIENDIPVVASDAVTFKIGGADVQSARFMPLSDNGQFYSTGGEWMTLTFDLTGDLGLSGAVTITSGDNGFAWNGSDIDLTGVCLDNLRMQLK